MTFNGLAVFKSSLKENASAIITEITDCGLSFKMITGDALNTSIFIYSSITKTGKKFVKYGNTDSNPHYI